MSDSRAAFDAWIEAFNAHDEAAIRAATADDCTFEGPGGVRLQGGDAVTAYAMVWLNAFSDAKLEVDAVVVDGDWVAHTGVFKGTHDGTLGSPDGDVPATGRRLEGRCSLPTASRSRSTCTSTRWTSSRSSGSCPKPRARRPNCSATAARARAGQPSGSQLSLDQL
jgi:predicted ester cyclase